MADNDQLNDEYQFTDLDAISPEQVDENQVSTEGDVEIEKESKNYNATNVKRNALIVVVALIFAMLVYKLLTRYLTSKKHETIPAAVIAPQPKLLKPEVNSPPAAPVESIGSEVSRKISTLELGQEGMRSDVASFNTQLGGISNSVNALAGQVAELNQIISALSAKVAAQSQYIEQITSKNTPKVAHPVIRKPVHYSRYNIQAVIPGRAWLIATNGATLTVSQGTAIPGYGIVKLIDPVQGKVTTSSGQIIRFSQEDS